MRVTTHTQNLISEGKVLPAPKIESATNEMRVPLLNHSAKEVLPWQSELCEARPFRQVICITRLHIPI